MIFKDYKLTRHLWRKLPAHFFCYQKHIFGLILIVIITGQTEEIDINKK